MLMQRRFVVSTIQDLGVASSFGSGDLATRFSLSQGLSVLYARCKTRRLSMYSKDVDLRWRERGGRS
jgi:hypothetical protein